MGVFFPDRNSIPAKHRGDYYVWLALSGAIVFVPIMAPIYLYWHSQMTVGVKFLFTGAACAMSSLIGQVLTWRVYKFFWGRSETASAFADPGQTPD